MTKKQKIWLSIFLAMFLIPEILWLSGIRGTIDIPWYPIANFDQLKGILLSFLTTIIPFIGILGLIKITAGLTVSKRTKTIVFLFLIPLFFWVGFLSLMFVWLMIFYANGAPQIG